MKQISMWESAIFKYQQVYPFLWVVYHPKLRLELYSQCNYLEMKRLDPRVRFLIVPCHKLNNMLSRMDRLVARNSWLSSVQILSAKRIESSSCCSWNNLCCSDKPSFSMFHSLSGRKELESFYRKWSCTCSKSCPQLHCFSIMYISEAQS